MNEALIINTLGIESQIGKGTLLADGFNSVNMIKKKTVRSFDQKGKDLFWQNHLKDHPTDFNGKVMSIEYFDLRRKVLEIGWYQSDWATFLFERKNRLSISSSPKGFNTMHCMPVSVGAITITEDDFIAFGSRTNTAIESKKIMLVAGGYIDPEIDCRNSLGSITHPERRCIERESKEELLINKIKSIKYNGFIYGSESMQPMINMEVIIPYTHEEMENIVKDNEELKNIVFVPNNIKDIARFIKSKSLAIHDAWKLLMFFHAQEE